VVVVEPVTPLGELLVHEVRQALGAPASSCTLADLERNPGLLSGALALTLPYHQEALARLAPEAAVEVVTLQMSDEDRKVIQALPEGAIVLVVSHCPTVLPFASVLLRTIRGEDALETRPFERGSGGSSPRRPGLRRVGRAGAPRPPQEAAEFRLITPRPWIAGRAHRGCASCRQAEALNGAGSRGAILLASTSA
jgi:hypothetical protein